VSELKREDAQKRVSKAVVEIEKKTSAEIVVVMRRTCGDYLRSDLIVGAIAALALLCVFLYHPAEFDFTYFPIEQLVAFVLGAVLCSQLPPLRRALVPKRKRREWVETAAKATFVDKGVSRTRKRSGVLVFVCGYEHDAVVVLDVGLDPKKLGEPLERVRESLRAAARAGDLDAFVRGLEALGACLAESYPATEDDVDELSNEVAA
jgi:putative membrane protein